MPIQKFEDLFQVNEKLRLQFCTLQQCCAFSNSVEIKMKDYLTQKDYFALQLLLEHWLAVNRERVEREQAKCQSVPSLTAEDRERIRAELQSIIAHEEARKKEEAERQKAQASAADRPPPMERPFYLRPKIGLDGKVKYEGITVDHFPQSCNGYFAEGGASISIAAGTMVSIREYRQLRDRDQEVMCIRLVNASTDSQGKDIYVFQDQWPLLQSALDAEKKERLEKWRHVSWKMNQVEGATLEHARAGVQMVRERRLSDLHRLEFILAEGISFYEEIASLCTCSVSAELCGLFTAYYTDLISQVTLSSSQNNRIRTLFTKLRGSPTLAAFYQTLEHFISSPDFEYLASVRRFWCCCALPWRRNPVAQEGFQTLKTVLKDTFGLGEVIELEMISRP